MTNFNRANDGRSDAGDPALNALLRAAYASPTSESYWAGLEQRVLARLSEAQPPAWWSVFADVRTVGLVAATLTLLLAGAAMSVHVGGSIAMTLLGIATAMHFHKA